MARFFAVNWSVALLLAAVCAGCESRTAPSPVVFTISGLKFGDPIADEFKRTHKRLTLYGEQLKGKEEYSEKVSLADGDMHITYIALDSKLEGAFVMFPAEEYETVLSIFVEKFGKPHRRKDVTYGSRVSKADCWETTDGEFALHQSFAGDPAHGGGYLYSKRYDDATREAESDKANDVKDKLRKSL